MFRNSKLFSHRYGYTVLQAATLGLHGAVGESVPNEVAVRRLQGIAGPAASSDAERFASEKSVQARNNVRR